MDQGQPLTLGWRLRGDMGTGQVLDRVGDSDLDFHEVSQLTTIGALAGEVVGDLIRVGAGLMRGSQSDALRHAAGVFTAVASDQVNGNVLWDSSRITDALRLLAEGTRRQAEVPSDDARGWIATLAQELSSVTEDRAQPELIEKLERQFSSLSVATLGASAEMFRQRGYASSWLTA